MKKSIIAMAVAGALAVPAIASADATLYGHVIVDVSKEKNEKLNVGGNANSQSRVGLRGTADTGIDGVSGIYNVEFGVGMDDGDQGFTTRLANAGLTGGFGTVLGGTLWAPHYSWATGTTDVMLSGIASTVHSTDSVLRVSNTLAYISPDLNGFQFAAAFGADSDNTDKNADYYHVAAKYSAHGFHGALSYVDFESDQAFSIAKDVTALGLSYETGPFFIGATYSHTRLDGVANYKPWDIAATYAVTDATALKASYADFRNGAKGYGVEVQHDLTSMVNAYVGYAHANSDLREANAAARAIDESFGGNSVFSTGLRVRF